MEIRPYQNNDENQVVLLWKRVFPITLPHHDPRLSISRKLKVDPDLFLVAIDNDKIIGTAMGGWDGHRGWVYSVSVDPQARRKGIGTRLLHEIEIRLVRRDCPKVNLQILESNSEVVKFYEKNGYEIEPRISMGKRLSQGTET